MILLIVVIVSPCFCSGVFSACSFLFMDLWFVCVATISFSAMTCLNGGCHPVVTYAAMYVATSLYDLIPLSTELPFISIV